MGGLGAHAPGLPAARQRGPRGPGSSASFFSAAPAWTGPPGQTTNNLVLGDVDGDGRLDLVCVNQGQPITLHRNRGGTFSVTPDWSSGSSEPSSGAALGDVNGDGLLDLVCQFDTLATGFGGDSTQGILRGLTTAGLTLVGADVVRIVR